MLVTLMILLEEEFEVGTEELVLYTTNSWLLKIPCGT